MKKLFEYLLLSRILAYTEKKNQHSKSENIAASTNISIDISDLSLASLW